MNGPLQIHKEKKQQKNDHVGKEKDSKITYTSKLIVFSFDLDPLYHINSSQKCLGCLAPYFLVSICGTALSINVLV